MIERIADFIKEYPLVGIPVMVGIVLLAAETLIHGRK